MERMYGRKIWYIEYKLLYLILLTLSIMIGWEIIMVLLMLVRR